MPHHIVLFNDAETLARRLDELQRAQIEQAQAVMRRDEARDRRIDDLEDQVARYQAAIDEYFGALETISGFLADAVARLRETQR